MLARSRGSSVWLLRSRSVDLCGFAVASVTLLSVRIDMSRSRAIGIPSAGESLSVSGAAVRVRNCDGGERASEMLKGRFACQVSPSVSLYGWPERFRRDLRGTNGA